jgi:mycofactocin system transcriptional regulator
VPKGTGRPPATSRTELERVALELFSRHGFVETTVDEIAEVAGIARRTLFRYYPSKNDLVWGDFDTRLAELEAWLAAAPTDRPLLETVRDAVVRFNALAPEEVASHRQRMSLILYVPALQAHSTLRYARWRGVVARFAAARLQKSEDDLGPQLVGHVALAAAVAAYERWLGNEGTDLNALLSSAFDAVVLELDQGADTP